MLQFIECSLILKGNNSRTPEGNKAGHECSVQELLRDVYTQIKISTAYMVNENTILLLLLKQVKMFTLTLPICVPC